MAIGSCSKCFCGVIRNIHVPRMPIRRSTSFIDVHVSLICHCSKQIANKMRLYHHITRCPVAMQLLLDTNPDLWCFVPMTNDQAMIDDLDFFATETPIVPENGQSVITTIGGYKCKPTCHKSDHSNAIDRFISQVSTPLHRIFVYPSTTGATASPFSTYARSIVPLGRQVRPVRSNDHRRA